MKKIVIVGGDPNSINSEIIYKCWKTLSKKIKKRIFLISNYQLISEQLKKLKYSIKLTKVKSINDGRNDDSLKVIDIKIRFKDPFKVSEKEASNFIINSLDLAHKIAIRKEVKGIINCAINKKLLKKDNIGVTEYLASKCGIKDNSETMLIGNKNLYVCPITTHIDLRNVPNHINPKKIMKKIHTIQDWYKKKMKRKPRIGILGLNPHNAELKKNSEEKKIIIPTISKIRKKGINLIGPLVADTLFINNYKNFDVIVGMYHDQVLAPFKTLFKFDAINITLGLKYSRVSPDHGTGLNIIKKNKANKISLLNCIKFIDKFGK